MTAIDADARSASKMTLSRDLTGRRFVRLVIVSHFSGTKSCEDRWVCRCDCGAETIVFSSNLTSGRTTSCGCRRREVTRTSKTVHGQKWTSLYKTWCGIKRRCLNKNDAAYQHYGAKGITVCDRWRESFEAFRSDMGEKPTPKHSIDRIDNTRGYEPDNCRWATRTEQARNKTSNKLNPETAAKIRELVSQGQRQRDVAALFGVSQRLICLIAKGVVWK